MNGLTIHPIPVLSDNYAYLLRDEATGTTAVVDPSEAAPVERALEERGWGLDYVLNTHHHWDHTGGNDGLRARYGAKVVAFRGDEHRIAWDLPVEEGTDFLLGSQRARVLEIPGHTRGHVAFFFEAIPAVFCGDTLFLMGCGKLFEGTPTQMWESLGKLRRLPPATQVWCGHEYTETNLAFALSLEPERSALRQRAERVRAARGQGRPTVPGTVAEERQTNPFLRADDPELQRAVGCEGEPPAAVLAEVRARKDRFRG